MDALSFDTNFPRATREQWLQSVKKVIKGGDFERILVSRNYDDIRIEPLYEQARDAAPILNNGARPWRIDQRIDLTDLTAANAQIHEDASGGADGFVLVGSEAANSRGFGFSLNGVKDIEQLLEGFRPNKTNLRIDAGPRALSFADNILKSLERQQIAPSSLVLDVACDPIGTLASRGYAEEPPEQTLHRCADFFSDARAHGFDVRIFLADGRLYHEAGASEAQELAAVLATALFYFRYFANHGIDLETARSTLSFLLVADADEFLTIAKFRALRRLWQRVEQACDIPPKPIRIHAETAWRMMSRHDPWTNILRSTAAVFSAATGGADIIGVLPFTNALGLPDANARRIARNTQLILLHEANLWRVADPAAGAGGFEELTSGLCNKAWKLFQRIEREGGIASSLEQGLLQSRIARSRQERQHDIFVKQRPITGISEFPDIRAEPVSILTPFSDLVTAASPIKSATILPLSSQRDAEPFEQLRDKIEAHSAGTGQRPRIFIATVGELSTFAGRATYASNFFEVAGIEAVFAEQPVTPETFQMALAESGADLVCLASSDDGYATSGKAMLAAVAKTGCRLVFAATGKAVDKSWIPSGFCEAIFPGCDALAALKRAVASVTASTAPQSGPNKGSR